MIESKKNCLQKDLIRQKVCPKLREVAYPDSPDAQLRLMDMIARCLKALDLSDVQ
jgi:hypothetical protein